jgi:GAF domain-containing protein
LSDLEWARVFANAARELASVQGSDETLAKIADLAPVVTGCPWAAIARATDHTPTVAATNDPVADRIAALQAEAGGGPSLEALEQQTVVHVLDLAAEHRWPEHVRALREQTPVRSLLALCIRLDDEPLGVLTLYSDQPDAFSPQLAEVVQVYADHAAIALDRARSDSKAENLQIALESSREIGIALGILVERYKITSEQAFDMMRVASQHSHRKLRTIAADLVHTGEFRTETGAGELPGSGATAPANPAG